MSAEERAAQLGLLKLADATSDDLEANRRALLSGAKKPPNNRVVTWFLPPVPHALKGGVRTVFMFAEQFSRQWGTLNHFVMYSYSGRDIDTQSLNDSLREYFPDLHYTINVFRRGIDDVTRLPASDAAICTLWTTAYLQLKYNQTVRKFYLVQDFEPNFYAAGAIYGVIEQTYRFGYSCLVNTRGVGQKLQPYTQDVTVFSPGVDRKMFSPDEKKNSIGKPARVVFYGRPSNPRNCFLLGIEILKSLKASMGTAVEIISVGEDWMESEYEVSETLENWGLLGSLDEVAELYRSADVGLVFMMTPHPSYQPLEYMASGCVTATNINEANQWLLNSENALLVPPVPDIAAAQIESLLRDPQRWQQLRKRAVDTIGTLNWKEATAVVLERMTTPRQPLGSAGT